MKKNQRLIVSYLLILISIITISFYIDNNASINKAPQSQQTEQFIEDGEDFSVTSGGIPSPTPTPDNPVNLVTSCTKTNLFEYLGGKGGAPIIQTSNNLVTYDGSVIAFSSNSDSSTNYFDSQINLVFPGPDKLLGTADDGKPIRIDAQDTNGFIENIDIYKNRLVWIESNLRRGSRKIYSCEDVGKDTSNCYDIYPIDQSTPIASFGPHIKTTDTHLAFDAIIGGNGVYFCKYANGCDYKNLKKIINLHFDPVYGTNEFVTDMAITKNYVSVVTSQVLGNIEPYSYRNKVYIYEISTGKLNTVFDSTKSYTTISQIDAGITSNPLIDTLFHSYYEPQYNAVSSRLSYILPGGIPDAIPGNYIVSQPFNPFSTIITGISRNIPYTYAFIYQSNTNGEYVLRIISGYKQFIDIPLSKINERHIYYAQLTSPNDFVFMQRNNNGYNAPFYVICS